MKSIKDIIGDQQIFIVLAGLLAGILFPHVFWPFHRYNTFMLQVIFFLSALRMDFREFRTYLFDWKLQLLASGFMLLFLPVAVYLPMHVFAPEWSLAFLIALSVPTGMTIALIADLFHGKSSLALAISLVTSALAPFTMPIVFFLLAGAAVRIDAFGMLRELLGVIIVPLVLAFLASARMQKKLQVASGAIRTVSLTVFGILIASIVSKSARQADNPAYLHLSLNNVIALFFAVFYVAFLMWVAYRMVSWRTVSERVTVALCMLYMNFTLAFYVGDRYFANQHVVPQLIVIVLLLDALLPLVRYAAGGIIEHEGKV